MTLHACTPMTVKTALGRTLSAMGVALSLAGSVACTEAPRAPLPAVGERPAGWVDIRLPLPDAGDATGDAASDDAERRLRARAGRYRLVADSPGLVVLRGEAQAGKASVRVGMAGELLTRTSVLEIVNVIANAGWRGQLHVLDGECELVSEPGQGTQVSFRIPALTS